MEQLLAEPIDGNGICKICNQRGDHEYDCPVEVERALAEINGLQARVVEIEKRRLLGEYLRRRSGG